MSNFEALKEAYKSGDIVARFPMYIDTLTFISDQLDLENTHIKKPRFDVMLQIIELLEAGEQYNKQMNESGYTND